MPDNGFADDLVEAVASKVAKVANSNAEWSSWGPVAQNEFRGNAREALYAVYESGWEIVGHRDAFLNAYLRDLRSERDEARAQAEALASLIETADSEDGGMAG